VAPNRDREEDQDQNSCYHDQPDEDHCDLLAQIGRIGGWGAVLDDGWLLVVDSLILKTNPKGNSMQLRSLYSSVDAG
jgi:hypothetical protein